MVIVVGQRDNLDQGTQNQIPNPVMGSDLTGSQRSSTQSCTRVSVSQRCSPLLGTALHFAYRALE